ncbi:MULTISPECIES: helix-turn-helix domain-containing protein [Oxalobacteraceae]|uniref:AraC family transcriptional regulator n=1 Tax=Herminiimonas sp. Marseille-P9896 TaxID=2742211 RepID=UPI00158BA095|nr:MULTISPECIES: helix-turn-helix transcriptional regulator [Oxalobacteraceae]
MNAKNRRKSDRFAQGRSENADDYQYVRQPITALARDQETGSYNTPHQHARGQLLYATKGLMRVASNNGIWFIPPTRGLWIPAGIVHDQLILSAVQMRTLYIDERHAAHLGDKVRVIEVSPMLRELILALVEEPVEYEDNEKNRAVVTLILHQLQHSKTIPLAIPWPTDRRLLAVCQTILDAPEHAMSIEYWAEQVGASSRTLIRLFLKETDLTFRQWVQQVKLASALSRLEDGVPIATLADELGYASPSAFSAMFKRVLGESPSSYLNKR